MTGCCGCVRSNMTTKARKITSPSRMPSKPSGPDCMHGFSFGYSHQCLKGISNWYEAKALTKSVD
jgi:hypothetical protein